MAAMDIPASPPYSPDSQLEVAALREELERLDAELCEANEERAQAAEYGLVVLEEKQALQLQHEELSGLYESTKRELETSVNAMKQVQTDYEKRLREVEAQRTQLLDEMESRETRLITKVSKLDDHIRQYERKLKQAVSEHDHVSEHNSYLNGELDRHRREAEMLKEENRRLKQEQTTWLHNREEYQKDLERHEKRINTLIKFESECSVLLESNRALHSDAEELRGQYDSIVLEREDLEYHSRQAVAALNEEREARTVLESKLRDVSVHSPSSPSWAEEKSISIFSAREGNHTNHVDDRPLSSPSPLASPGHAPGEQTHSTPYASKKAPSLLSELQKSFMESVDSTELESLRTRCKETDDTVTALQREKLTLEEKIGNLSLQQTHASSEADKVRDGYSRAMSESERVLESLKEEMLIKEEMLTQMRNKISTASAEKSSMKIEIDGLRDELERLRNFNTHEVEKIQKELTDEVGKCEELRNQNTDLEDQIAVLLRAGEKLEGIISSSHSELNAMNEEIKALHKAVATLGSNHKLVVGRGRELSPSAGKGAIPEEDTTPTGLRLRRLSDVVSEATTTAYTVELKRGRESVRVHDETHSMLAIVQLHKQLRSIRSPLEQFAKVMLERSLAQSTRHIPNDAAQPGADKPAGAGRHSFGIDTDASAVNKLKSMFVHKTEEVNNLRAIMKARATTADVATSSLRSKLEGQARTYQAELVRLKHQLKAMKKERDDHRSSQAMYSKRCDEYGEQITRLKQDWDRVKEDNDELLVSLKKTIQRKLELARELEEYRVEQERLRHIPLLLNSSRI